MRHRRASRSLPALLLALTALGSPATEPPAPALLEQKLRLLEALIARTERIDSLSRNDRATLEVSRTLVEVARQERDESQLVSAMQSLDEALRLLGQIARASRTPGREDARRAFESLLETSDGLFSALRSTLTERGAIASAKPLIEEVEHDRSRAVALHQRGEWQSAGEVLRRVYHRLSATLAELRRSETVVHALRFDSPADELAYERRRLRSSKLLIRMLIGNDDAKDPRSEPIRVELQAAAELEREASEAAASGQVRRALNRAELANRHLGRALARLGVFTGAIE